VLTGQGHYQVRALTEILTGKGVDGRARALAGNDIGTLTSRDVDTG